MNADISSVNAVKYKRLEEKPHIRIYKPTNSNCHKVVHNASETNPAISNLNQSIENRQTADFNPKQEPHTSSSPMKNIHSMAANKHQTYKLVDSKQMSKPFQQSDKKMSLLDTYAHIAASNNKRCSKRLLELAMPRRRAHNDNQNDSSASLRLNHLHTIKTYSSKTRPSAENTKKK